MKNKYWSGVLLFLLLMIKNIFACPFVINNDTQTEILVVDPYNKQALYINSGDEAEIDPSISGWQYYLYHEKLDIYVPQEDNPDLFYRRYQLMEKYCTTEKTKLTLSDITQFINKPTDRFTTSQFNPHQHDTHIH